jgi:hypothetical protein
MKLHQVVLVVLLISLTIPGKPKAQVAPPLTKVVMTIGAISGALFMLPRIKDFFASMGSILRSSRCATARSALPR